MLVRQFKFKRNHDKGGLPWMAQSEIERPGFYRGFTAVGMTLADVKEFADLVRYCERTGKLERLSEMHPPGFERRMQTTWGGNWYPNRTTPITICDDLLRPQRLWTRSEVLSRPSPVPKAPGIYAWYFRSLPSVPSSACRTCGDFTLLYTGISPSAPPRPSDRPGKRSLYHRIREHMSGNAFASTLRLSLGCLLADDLGIELRRVGSGDRLTFSSGEERLSQWMDENARVVWMACEEPWNLEPAMISTVCLPLNLDDNDGNEFAPVLSELRTAARARARSLPILPR